MAKCSTFRGWFGTVGLKLQENIMPDWSIKIEGKPAVFTPDIEPFKPGKPLKVVQGDIVSWDNESDDPHFPVPDDPATFGNFMTSAVTPDDSSDGYNVNAVSGTTISYHCSLHPNERGQIVVVDFGASDTDGTEDLIA
jgi:plastocyanin